MSHSDNRRGATSLAAATSPEDSVDEVVDRVVRELNALCKKATFDFATSVGRLIVDRFYGGDLDAWRNRGPKVVSFRMLARHPDLPMSPAALYRSVAIYELSRSLPAGHCVRLSTSHLRLVLPLARADQLRLLAEADAQGWSVSRLRERVALLEVTTDKPARSRGGRKRGPRLRKTMRILQSCLQPTNSLVGADDDDLDLSPETARSLADLLERVRDALSSLQKQAARLTNESGAPREADP